KYPEKQVLFQNSLHLPEVKKWEEMLHSFSLQEERKSLDIDYKKYGLGEQALAWFDAEWILKTSDGKAVEQAMSLVNKFYSELRLYPIGHLKFLLKKIAGKEKLVLLPAENLHSE